MKQLQSLIVIVAFGLLGLQLNVAQARTLAEIHASKTLNVVTTASNPPAGFMDPATNSLKGIMVEVGEAIAKHLGTSIAFINVPFSGLIPALTSGRADLMSAPLFITEERAKAVAFTAPIYGWGEGIIVSDKTTKQYGNLEDLKGAKVGVLVDSVQYRMIKDLPGTEVSTYPDYSTLLADVKAGRIDVGVVDPPSIIYQIRSKSIPGLKFDSAYKPQKVWWVGAAVQKGDQPLLGAVNEAIANMKKTGELHAILNKWGVADLEAK